MIKKIFSIVIAFALVLVCCACGSGPSGKYKSELDDSMTIEFKGKQCILTINEESYTADYTIGDDGQIYFETKCPIGDIFNGDKDYTEEERNAALAFGLLVDLQLRYDKSAKKIVGGGDYSMPLFSPISG